MKQIHKEIAATLKALRKKKKMTLKQLGARIGMSHNYISEIENCKKRPTLDNVSDIALGLGCKLDFKIKRSKI